MKHSNQASPDHIELAEQLNNASQAEIETFCVQEKKGIRICVTAKAILARQVDTCNEKSAEVGLKGFESQEGLWIEAWHALQGNIVVNQHSLW